MCKRTFYTALDNAKPTVVAIKSVGAIALTRIE